MKSGNQKIGIKIDLLFKEIISRERFISNELKKIEKIKKRRNRIRKIRPIQL